LVSYEIQERLRRNPPEQQVDKNFVRRLITLYYKLMCDCFKYRLKKYHFQQHQISKRNLSFIWNTWNIYRENETDDEILSVFAQFLWTLKFIFSSSYKKSFSVLFQETIYIFTFKKK